MEYLNSRDMHRAYLVCLLHENVDQAGVSPPPGIQGRTLLKKKKKKEIRAHRKAIFQANGPQSGV